MEHQVTLNIPDAVYQHARRIAKMRGVKLENVLVGVLRAHWSPADTPLTETEKLAAIAPSIESTDWWDSEGDKEWDAWTPKIRPTEQSPGSHWILIICRLAKGPGMYPQSNNGMNAYCVFCIQL